MPYVSLTLVFLVAFLLALILTPPARAWALRQGLVDRPGEARRVHRQPLPRPGGLALYGAFALAVLLSLLLADLERPPDELPRLGGLVVGGLVALGLGLYDDRRELRPWPQLLGQALAAAVAAGAGITVEHLSNPFGEPFALGPWLGPAFAILWIMALMNTINWLDGLDGLAAGVTAIAGLVLFVRSVTLMPPQHSIAVLALALAGASWGFLPFNFYPAKIFLGSSGAYFLGFTLAVLSIIGGAKVATALLVVGLPVLDAAWVIVHRLARGASPFRGDRRHLHHRLLDLGFSQPQIVLMFYFLCALLGALALVLSKMQKLYALAGLAVVVGGALVLITRHTMYSGKG